MGSIKAYLTRKLILKAVCRVSNDWLVSAEVCQNLLNVKSCYAAYQNSFCSYCKKLSLPSKQEFHESLHSLLLWLAHAESRRYTVDISHPDTPVRALQQHRNTLRVSRYNRILSNIHFPARTHRHHSLFLWFAGSAGGAAGQAESAGLPPGSVVSAPAWGGGRGRRRGPGETPRDRQQTEVAAEAGGPGPQHPATASGKSLRTGTE